MRYYALEALFNIAKVTRESFMPFFSDTFEALFRLSADMDSAVQLATTYLDNLLKVLLLSLITLVFEVLRRPKNNTSAARIIRLNVRNSHISSVGLIRLYFILKGF